MLKPESVGSWGVRSGAAIVPLAAADAVLLLSAASGLAGALVHAGGVPLATRVAAAYLRLRSNAGDCPISALASVRSREHSFPAVCLTDHLTVQIDGQTMQIPVNLIQTVGIRSRRRLELKPKASISLVDGSVYKQAKISESHLDVLTLLGRQRISLKQSGVLIKGHSISELDELRQRIEATLDKHRHAVLQTVGHETFERYFTAA